MKEEKQSMQVIEMVLKASNYASHCHESTNHKYNGKSYSIHLNMVYDYALKYINLLSVYDQDTALAASWTHDVIEDCRQTYNDVKQATNERIADVTYALTNEKGKNRKQRANDKYYDGIRENPVSMFVKICDRLANAKYSKDNGSSMLDAYRKEKSHFYNMLYCTELAPMLDELNEILK